MLAAPVPQWSGPAPVCLGPVEVELSTGRVDRPDGARQLTEMERALLAWLAAHPGEVASRHTLLREVWGDHERVYSRTVDTTMRRLRCKVELDPRRPRFLLTEHGRGYRLSGTATARVAS